MTKPEDFLVEPDNCTRCGACFAASQLFQIGSLKKNSDGYPVVATASDSERLQLRGICTGMNLNYLDLMRSVHGDDAACGYDPTHPDFGTYKQVLVCRARNVKRRQTGQSGGVSTGLIHAGLSMGVFDGFLAVRRPVKGSLGSPYESEPFIVRTEKDLIAAAGSKYTICTSLEILPELLSTTESFGASLLPCQTAAFHQLKNSLMPDLHDRCKLIIGPFCGLNMNKKVGHEIADALGISDVRRFANRAGTFPGTTELESASGTVTKLDRTAHRPLYRMFSPNRCFSCTDFGNELSDITIADFWRPGASRGTYFYSEGAAWLVTRTERGAAFLEQAVQDGFLEILEKPTPTDAAANWKESFTYRKVRAFNRIRQHKKAGIATPTFDFPLPDEQVEFRTADRTEWYLRCIFRSGLMRKTFLKWWLKCHLEGVEKQKSHSQVALVNYLSRNVFTHRSDTHSLTRICTNIVKISFWDPVSNRLKRFLKWANLWTL